METNYIHLMMEGIKQSLLQATITFVQQMIQSIPAWVLVMIPIYFSLLMIDYFVGVILSMVGLVDLKSSSGYTGGMVFRTGIYNEGTGEWENIDLTEQEFADAWADDDTDLNDMSEAVIWGSGWD